MEPQREAASALDTSTFSAGIRLLPGDLQADARDLYLVLRTIDDLVDDEDPHAEQRVEAIEHWAHSREADTPETRIRDMGDREALSMVSVCHIVEQTDSVADAVRVVPVPEQISHIPVSLAAPYHAPFGNVEYEYRIQNIRIEFRSN